MEIINLSDFLSYLLVHLSFFLDTVLKKCVSSKVLIFVVN